MNVQIEVEVEMDYYRGCEMRMYMRNGDPGYPAEPPEAEVQKVFIGLNDQRRDISDLLSPDEISDLEDQFLEDEPELDGPDY
jgi:hypothetical protein